VRGLVDELFGVEKPVIGVVHLLPLPGSPRYGGSLEEVLERALEDARALVEGGVDGLILENFGDKPFPKRRISREGLAAFAVVAREVVREVSIPVGINVLRNDALSAMAIAYASGARFIRVNVYADVVAADQGIVEPAAWDVLRYRRWLGADVRVYADVLVKHSRPLYPADIETSVKNAVGRGLADAVIVTGPETGSPPDLSRLRAAKRAAGSAPVFAGSGVVPENAVEVLAIADGAIVGTYFKIGGITENPVDRERVERLVSLVRRFYRK